ncbi:unnamed protein product, partial [Meganyctiphanes norvegica]
MSADTISRLVSLCRSMPKIELHAHLSGSLSDSTVLRLLNDKRQQGDISLPESAEFTINRGPKRTIDECFEIFSILHKLTDSLSAVSSMTKDVIREFAADNVCYLELRTTPKLIPGVMDKNQYIEAVLDAIIDEEKESNIMVRLLLSLDRGRPLQDNKETLQMAKYYHNHKKKSLNYLDEGDPPRNGKRRCRLPLFSRAAAFAQMATLKLNLIKDDGESLAVLRSGFIDRIGHGTYLHTAMGGDQACEKIVAKSLIPIEICLSSNCKSHTVESIEKHHIQHWLKLRHPLIICTDDKGVFSTTLSEEFILAVQNFSLDDGHLEQLCYNGVDASFLPQADKEILRQKITNEFSIFRH